MKSGWVHGSKLHTFSSEGTQFVIMTKVAHVLIYYAKWNYPNCNNSQRMSAGFYYPAIILHQMEQPTVLVWHAGYVYLHQCLNYVAVNRLGEVCLHITVVTSCMINAKEAHQQTDAHSCISTLCGWSHSAREVRMNNTSVVIM